MFEDELAMEKKSSTILPGIVLVALLVCVAGGIGYLIWRSTQHVTPQQAAVLATESLKAQGPAVVQFVTGPIDSEDNVNPQDPQYRLLEKAGILKIKAQKNGKKRTVLVSLTEQGEKQLHTAPELKIQKRKSGGEVYVVPLAERRLVGVSSVAMDGPDKATVEFAWKWNPNPMGNLFDVSGPLVSSFNQFDRATLIEKDGAGFYRGDPNRMTETFVREGKGWRVAE
jgi:flagellar basal body-associated protein FliL